ncbi:hypothetical protein EPO66_04610 [bacterium]|nr:MAG: hypothetical protein EPO66_04610 [bacterium]
MKSDPLGAERRQYLRLDTVFPVSFQLISEETKEPLSEELQGFTNNISKGGICLAINNLKPELSGLIREKKARVALKIEVPLHHVPVCALANISWFKEDIDSKGKFFIGLDYEEIPAFGNKRIMRYAWTRRLFAPTVLAIAFVFALGFGINTYINFKLVKGNKDLVDQLVKILQDSTLAKEKIRDVSKEKEDLQLKMQTLEVRLKTLEDDRAKIGEKEQLEELKANKKLTELNNLIGKLNQEKATLQDVFIKLQKKENNISEELLLLDKNKVALTQANFDKMYQWLRIHQNQRTGLISSFEGDSEVANWAFIYDQSLAAQAYVNFSDFERARKMFDFFARKAKREGNLFHNAYYVTDGSVAEYTVHCGPNIWLGIALVQYTQKTHDNRYLTLAEEIADGIISLQDPDGGLRGGPDTDWYSTEHNLDAYSFLNMLYQVTSNDKYLKSRDKVLSWLAQNTYNRDDVPIKRGKGDSTIATDTYAWSIAAIGPKKLEEIGMNPDQILEFAEQSCSVEVSYDRPGGKTVRIKGFDFAPQTHVVRGGVVSSEWTAQMIMSFKIMADFYSAKGMDSKASVYKQKANEYLAQLSNMIISSPSPSGQGEGCLPYASVDFVDTGHGWMTPKGKNTGSVSGTAYTIFAYYNYNPLELK